MHLFRNAISFFRVPLTRFYLRKEREYRYGSISVIVKPGVFHPGLFPSTRMLLEYLAHQVLVRGASLLELGCGTGLISIVTEQLGTVVTSSDISSVAIENTRINAEKYQSKLVTIQSDLFDRIPTQVFDWIVINPPYYAKEPRTEAETAWYCGANFEYFRKLFPALKDYISKDSKVLMTLTESCDINAISSIAGESGFRFDMLTKRHSWHEGNDYLFRIIRY